MSSGCLGPENCPWVCAGEQGHFQMLGYSILGLAGHCAPWSWGAVGMLAREGRCISEEKLHCHTASVIWWPCYSFSCINKPTIARTKRNSVLSQAQEARRVVSPLV